MIRSTLGAVLYKRAGMIKQREARGVGLGDCCLVDASRVR